MRIINFLFIVTSAYEYTFDRESGVLLKSMDDVYVYDSEIPTDIAIMIDSPRNKFRESMKADCGDRSTGLPPMEHNFFGLPEKRIDTESMYCTQAFDTFDHIVLSYIASDL